jgi:class 3 adenylate cyclase
MAPTATVTLLFCDLVGSTAWQSALGDDAADDVRPAIFTALRAAVENHGGRACVSHSRAFLLN